MSTQNETPASLYLSLMKKVLSFSLWDDPGIPIELHPVKRSKHIEFVIHGVSLFFRLFGLQVIRRTSHTMKQITDGEIWPWYADTMIGLKRLDNLQYCIENIIENKVEGDLIETGVWRGGACIFMRAILAAYQIKDRCVFVADSFTGLPNPATTKYPQDVGDRHHHITYLAVPLEQVKANFDKYGLLDEQVAFIKGWFADTLPHLPSNKLAVLRLDGDMYGSTMDALINLYPKLSSGGFCIVDDYGLVGCRNAVDDFRSKWRIVSPFTQVDRYCVYWQKE